MTTQNIYFIDARVADYQSLISSLPINSEWFVLDANQDGIEQIQSILTNYSGLDSIQILSHGSQGSLYLGSTILNNSNINSYTSQLGNIGNSLTSTGDILLYGCNVAQGIAGQAFINSLSQYTGADVASSDDKTGAIEFGGNWVLEVAVGSVGAASINPIDYVGILTTNTAPTFSVGSGSVTTAIGSNNSFGKSVALQADGKIILAGNDDNDFVIARYNTDGSLDANFDGDGIVTASIGLNADTANSVVVQADGKILVGGYSRDSPFGSNTYFTLVRYNSDGSLDTSFDIDGIVTTNIDSSYDKANSVVLQTDGKILVGGSSTDANENSYFTLVRYNSDGSLDSSFDTDGVVTTVALLGHDGITSISLEANGKIVVGGYSSNSVFPTNTYIVLARYNTDGSLDATFDNDGKVIPDIGSSRASVSGIAQQTDGKIVVAGSSLVGGYWSSNDFLLVRFNNDGSLDTSFDTDGIVTTGIGSGTYTNLSQDVASSVAIQADGKILVSGYTYIYNTGTEDFCLVRYNSDGSLDTSFGTDGKVITTIGSNRDFGTSVTLQTDGKILIGGYSFNLNSGNVFALARYNTDGSLDVSFSSPVNTLTAAPTYYEGSYSIILDSNVKVFDAELSAANNYDGSTLTLSRHNGSNSQDIFSTLGASPAPLSEGSSFFINGVNIGQVTTNSGGTLTLAFNANATQPLVSAMQQKIAYANTSHMPPATVQIDWIFSDGNTGSQGAGGAKSVTGSTTVNIITVNDAPYISKAIPNIVILPDTAFNYAIPNETFIDPDGDTLSYSLSMVNGTPVPSWLHFDTSTRILSGTPSVSDTGNLYVRITATDGSGASATNYSYITVEVNVAPTLTSAATILPTGTEDIVYNVTTGQLLTGWTDANTESTVISLTDLSANNGTVIRNNDNTYSITSSPNYHGTMILSYNVTDGVNSVITTLSYNITAANDAPTGIVTITGTATQGQTLMASNNLIDIDGLGTITYQWQADGSNINGATSNTLVLAEAQVGQVITVHASYIDGQSTAESVVSAATEIVAIAPTNIINKTAAGNLLSSTVNLGDSTHTGIANDLITILAPTRLAVTNTINGQSGTDEIRFTSIIAGQTLTLGAGITNVENLTIGTGSADIADTTATTALNVNASAVLTGMTITGNDGNNIITGTKGADTINAGAGNDIIVGNNGDLIDGGIGNDFATYSGSGITSTFNGGDGNDTLAFVRTAGGNDIVFNGGAGFDEVRLSVGTGLVAHNFNIGEVNGTGNNGSSAHEIEAVTLGTGTGVTALTTSIVANNIDATGYTENGLTLTGNAGANAIIGTALDDIINGGLGADAMSGGTGDDTYFVDNVNDLVTEDLNSGVDLVKVSIAAAGKTYTLTDNVENATLMNTVAFNLTGNDLENILTGNNAANILDGKVGADTMNGGKGADTYIVDNEFDTIIEEFTIAQSGGVDLVKSSETFTLEDNLDNLTLTDGTLTGGIAAINGTGNDLNNIIIGNAGDNILTGNAGVDKLTGNAGNDTLDGGAGNDKMNGGAGDDLYIVDSTLDVVTESLTIANNGGIDTVESSVKWTLGTNFDNLTLTGVENINGTGNALNNTITGNDGNNILLGLDGIDTLIAGAGNDTLDGGAKVDSLAGGDGDDTYIVDLLTTGTGVLAVTTLQDSITENLDSGIDTITLRGTATLTNASTIDLNEISLTEIENLNASLTVSTKLNLTGNTLNNTLTGNAAINILDGGDGNDTLDGKAGADTLIGGIGNDTLIGGAGNDSLTGGDGLDVFVFNTALSATANVDVITDFVSGEDAIQLSAAIFTKLKLDNDLSDNLYIIGGNVAQDANDYISYDLATGKLYYDANASTAGLGVQFATLTGTPTLTGGDFTLVA